MSYIGKTPTPAPLTSSDITDGIITSAKIANGGVETVDIADANVTAAKLASGTVQNQSSFKNIIQNGDMSIAQRATSVTGITGNGYHTIDRMFLGLTSAGTWTQSQSTDVPTGQGFAKSLKMDNTTADGSLSAGDNCIIQIRSEGQNLQYLKKGTSSAESITVSFWVYATKTGTNICELYDTDNTRQISQAYTISSSNTWEKKTLTFAGDTTGAFGNDNGVSLTLLFWLAAGSNFSSGTLSTTWTSATNANRAVGHSDSTTVSSFLINFMKTMRAAPTLAYTNIVVTDNVNYDLTVNSIATSHFSIYSGRAFFNHNATATQYRTAFLKSIANSATSSGITLTSEL